MRCTFAGKVGPLTHLPLVSCMIPCRYFSQSVLQYVGGSLFLVFAAATVIDIFAQVAPLS